MKHGQNSLKILVPDNGKTDSKKNADFILPLDYLVREPEKIAGSLLSKMKLNTRVFARNCEMRKIDKTLANTFLDRYHIMNSTQSAFNYALYYKNELLAVASFSKGRKMNRLREDKRSFELIRFCCKNGYSIPGGLSKLVRGFVREKKAGDVMTYVDRQWSDGTSFAKAGFKLLEKRPANLFRVNRKDFTRELLRKAPEQADTKKYYFIQDSGNLKMVFVANEGV